jgi:hypothetical protein
MRPGAAGAGIVHFAKSAPLVYHPGIMIRPCRSLIAGLLFFTFATTAVTQGQQNPILGDTTTRVSDHVWAIMGFPNIGI